MKAGRTAVGPCQPLPSLFHCSDPSALSESTRWEQLRALLYPDAVCPGCRDTTVAQPRQQGLVPTTTQAPPPASLPLASCGIPPSHPCQLSCLCSGPREGRASKPKGPHRLSD